MSKHSVPADQKIRGRWLVFLATVFWGTTATLARSVFRDAGVDPLMVVELRLVIAALGLLLWMLVRDRSLLRVDPKDLGYLVVLGIAGVAAVQGTYYYAIAKLGVGPAILLAHSAGGGSTDAHFWGGVMAQNVDLELNSLSGNATSS